MALVHCRACEHQVDTSALACPSCGATDPGHKISRQQRNLITTTIQVIVFVIAVTWAGSYAWKTFVPMAKEALARPQQQMQPTPEAVIDR